MRPCTAFLVFCPAENGLIGDGALVADTKCHELLNVAAALYRFLIFWFFCAAECDVALFFLLFCFICAAECGVALFF